MRLVTITGPSGSGKTTLVRELLKTGHFCEVVSFTTRGRRVGEVDGVDYYFISQDLADSRIADGSLIEHVQFNGVTYGLFREEVDSKLKSGKIPLLIVEPVGLAHIKELIPTFSIYIDSPIEVLYERFLERFAREASSYPSSLNIPYHAKRLAGIQKEKELWRTEIFYDTVVESFTSESRESTISSLIRSVNYLGEISD